MSSAGSSSRPAQSGCGTKYVAHQNGVAAAKRVEKREVTRDGRGMPGNWPSNQGQEPTPVEVVRVR